MCSDTSNQIPTFQFDQDYHTLSLYQGQSQNPKTQVTYQVYISKNLLDQVNPINVYSSSNIESKMPLRLIIKYQQNHQYSNNIIRGKTEKYSQL